MSPNSKLNPVTSFVRRLRRLPRAAHGLGHACVCVFVLAAWAVPLHGPSRSTTPPTPARAATPGEEETDDELQRAATSALGGREGAVLVLDARSGRLRAVVNSRLAFEQATAPGSTIKAFTELAALEESVLGAETRALCRGRYEGGGLKFNCAHPQRQPPFDPVRALAHSCNNYFGRVGERLDGESYRRRLAAFGFGARTGADEREAAGALPRVAGGVAAGAEAALGESRELQVTPVQLLTAYAALANGGRLFVPRRAHGQEEFAARERARLEIADEHRALLLAGMRGATAYGTAARAGLGTLPVYVFGKTGTSTPADDFRPQGWFVGLAADHEPDGKTPPPESVGLAVLVLLKRAHGSDSALAARPVFETYARILRRKAEGEGGSSGESEKGRAGAAETFDETTSSFSSAPALPFSPSRLSVRLAREDVTLRLSLDDYVFGVLAAEGSVEDELEALKAQAVVSRTYALKNLRRHARDHYDLCNSTHCQRYVVVRDEGRRPEFYALVRRAVSETSGEVLRERQGRLAESYFSASCGGATADIASLWGVRAAPAHLRGGVRDEFCTSMPHRSWTDAIPRDQLLRALRTDARSDVGARLDAVRVLKRDRTGRAELILLEGERPRTLRGWDFKIIVGRELGWMLLKSSRFEVTRRGADFVFRGAGFGHGLGLCQFGAHVMARRGATYRQILAHYLPGTTTGVAAEQTKAGGANAERESGAAQEHPNGAGEERGSAAGGGPAGAAVRHARWTLGGFRISNLISQIPKASRRLTLRSLSAVSPRVDAFAAARARASRRTMSSEHFRVSYPARSAQHDVEGALRALEAARAEVLRRLDAASLSAAPLAPASELFVHATTGDFTAATGQPAWVAATTRGRRVESQPLETLRRRRVLDSTLRHEFVHVAAEALSRGRAPRWLVEGLAVHVAGEGRLVARDAPKRKPTLEEIERGLERTGSAREMRALYAAAYGEVRALIEREGEAGVWRRVARG